MLLVRALRKYDSFVLEREKEDLAITTTTTVNSSSSIWNCVDGREREGEGWLLGKCRKGGRGGNYPYTTTHKAWTRQESISAIRVMHGCNPTNHSLFFIIIIGCIFLKKSINCSEIFSEKIMVWWKWKIGRERGRRKKKALGKKVSFWAYIL